ncbi:MAG TPA: family 78 glycoside hydrolase catalytic domain, partial [Chitinophagaceae bacterium]|nr:family 78 glycoside hydrolase catalytic domain [Chitinophagaceae bacterium]
QLVTFGGSPLQPFTRYWWSVRLWDAGGRPTPWAPSASFETGMMDRHRWTGSWISDSRDIHLKAAPYFRKAFRLPKKVRSARAYLAAAGLYELTVNGQRIGNQRLDPTYTRFDRRILYVTHDVTAALQSGDNAIGVLLGNGWYNHQSTAVWFFHEAPWRSRPAFCLDLRITYEDGSVETIATGKDWKTSLSPVFFNSIYTAEHYDARLEQPGWDGPSFRDTSWREVIFRSAPADIIAAQMLHPIRPVEEVPARSVRRFSDTVYVFDIGRNISGISRLRVRGPRGTVIKLKHAERLYANGRADQSNIDVHYRPQDASDPFQTDIFILKGEGEEEFLPRFNYKGFQFVELSSSVPLSLGKENLTAYFLHSDVPVAGTLQSSDSLVNRLWWATNNSYLSNLVGYPTDCPQREKNGWTGDAHIAVETGLYNFDGITVYEKWMADHRDEQQGNGVLPSIIPTGGWGYEWGNGPDWTSTMILIPWNLYLFYGDTTVLQANYTHMKRYLQVITDRSKDGLTSWGLGDWVPVTTKPPVEFTSSVYYYTDALLLSKIARVLGQQEEARQYAALAEYIRTAFNKKYLDRTTGRYGTGLQTEQSMPLQWGLVPDDLRAKAAEQLALRVKADNNHLNVGLLGTKAILNALSENGYADLAYTVATQKTFPSWGWWIVNGATTLYENWPIDAKSDLSLNHIMFGEVGAWMYKALGGLRPDPDQPGFRNTLVEPHFVQGLEACSVNHESPYGTIVSSWKRSAGKVQYTLVIPANASATLKLPAGTWQQNGRPVKGGVLQLPAGSYVFAQQ